jgi:hypothetical protein
MKPLLSLLLLAASVAAQDVCTPCADGLEPFILVPREGEIGYDCNDAVEQSPNVTIGTWTFSLEERCCMNLYAQIDSFILNIHSVFVFQQAPSACPSNSPPTKVVVATRLRTIIAACARMEAKTSTPTR